MEAGFLSNSGKINVEPIFYNSSETGKENHRMYMDPACSAATLSIDRNQRKMVDQTALKNFAKAATIPLAVIAAASLNSVFSTDGGSRDEFIVTAIVAQVGATFCGITSTLLLVAIQLLPDNSFTDVETYSSMIVVTILSWFIFIFYAALYSVYKGMTRPARSVLMVDANGQIVNRYEEDETYYGDVVSRLFAVIFVVAVFLCSYWAVNLILYRTFFRTKRRLAFISVGLGVLSVAFFFAVSFLL